MMSAIENKTNDVFGATLSRRTFVKGTGALIVAVSVPAAFTASSSTAASSAGPQLDPSRLASWLEINSDNTVLIRTGKVDMGYGTSAAYRQIVAEELNVPFESITKLVMGSTDTTPDGGVNGGINSAANLRKVAAFTYQALLGLASTKLGVPVGSLSVTNGVVSGGGKSISYGDLIKDQQLNLTISTTGTQDGGTLTVSGNPPLKPVSQYSIIGKSYPSPMTTDIVSGSAVWVASIRLPGMLHARMVKPKTLGSTLVSVGKLDKRAFPNAQVVVKGNLVGVVSPSEWEAIGASQQVAATTKWSDWSGLPGSGNLLQALRSTDYSKVAPVSGNANRGNVGAAMAGAAKTLSATYLRPYIKHGPIGPSIAVADVRKDGTTHVWYHGQAPQLTQRMVASILNTSMSNVVVHWVDGSGQYGRSNPGPDGAEAEAVLLSQAVGRPVRLQWTRQEDMQWSTTTFAVLSDVKVGLNASGNITALQANYYQRGRFDGRGLGALLAGTASSGGDEDGNPTLPKVKGNYSWSYGVSTQTGIYDKITNLTETGYGAAPFGQVESPYKVGMRIHSMRTPVQREENMALEGIINEAAAAVGVDPIEYRLRHTTDQRLINVLNQLKAEHGWDTRPSPKPGATATGSKRLTGRGMGVMLRSNGYHAAAADITVNPKTGKITVDRYTTVFEGGIIVNPMRVQRNAENGATQGISEVLREVAAFDKGMITSTDWVTYPILRMVDLPVIKAVIISRPDLGVYAQGSEGFNSLPYVAIPAALFDATGKVARTTPLRPANVRAVLAT
jgi:CO/xanthine dehydrogenase Mo-binding subunit